MVVETEKLEFEPIAIKQAERLHGCDGHHYIELGEAIDLYVMGDALNHYTVFAYADRDCIFIGTPQPTQSACCREFVDHCYGCDRKWKFPPC